MSNLATFPEIDISQIAGNAPDNMKLLLGNVPRYLNQRASKPELNTFGKAILLRMKLTELSIIGKAEEPKKLEARVVLEMDVAEDMVNSTGIIHGGCLALLIDNTSSFALVALHFYQTGIAQGSVSQALNIVYHSPAMRGDRIRLVNTTIALGSRVESVQTEIWNVTQHRLVASGVHVKMSASKPSNLKAAL